MTSARFDLVTIDTPDPRRLAGFWCPALGLTVVENEDDGRWLALAEPDGTRRLGLQVGAAGSGRGRLHLDLACADADLDAEVERLVGLGADLLRPIRPEPYGRIANLADPDANPFDLVASTP